MKFYSTNDSKHVVNLQEAIINGLAPDNGLYMPERIPVFKPEFFNSLSEKSFQEIAFDVAQAFVEDDISAGQLKKIIAHTIAFDAPLVEIVTVFPVFAIISNPFPLVTFQNEYGAPAGSSLSIVQAGFPISVITYEA